VWEPVEGRGVGSGSATKARFRVAVWEPPPLPSAQRHVPLVTGLGDLGHHRRRVRC
jgi:hypothetical protein